MATFGKNDSLLQLQKFITDVYGEPGDKHFSLFELIAQQARFSMRILKDIRKGDDKSLEHNMAVAISWTIAIANRLHIDISDALWQRFPGVCSFCGKRPCICKKDHLKKRVSHLVSTGAKKPKTLAHAQKELGEIYPKDSRTLEGAALLLAEEVGEFSEAINQYYLTHQKTDLEQIKFEIADYLSCLFDIANSSNINMAESLTIRYGNNCPKCHKLPCTCDLRTASFVI